MIERGEGVWVFDADGPSLPRRHRVALVRQPRARARGDRRRRRGADEAPRGLPHVRRLRQPPGQRAVRGARRARADGRTPRSSSPAAAATAIDAAAKLARRHFVAAGPARARAPDLAHPGLPRHARLRHVARRDRGQHDQLGPAGPAGLDGPVRLAARAGAGDPARRAGQGRRVLLRAGDRRRRRPPAARRATSRASPTSAPSTGSCS